MNNMSIELYASTPAVGLLKGFSPLPHQLEVDVVVPHQENGLPGVGFCCFCIATDVVASCSFTENLGRCRSLQLHNYTIGGLQWGHSLR